MDIGTGYYGHVAVTTGIVRGKAALDPVLEIQLKIQADGFAPGGRSHDRGFLPGTGDEGVG